MTHNDIRTSHTSLLDWHMVVSNAILFGSEKAICFALLSFIDWRTGRAHPSIETIADSAGLRPRTIQKHLKHLIAKGIITIEAKSAGRSTHRLRMNRVALQAISRRITNDPETAHNGHDALPAPRKPVPAHAHISAHNHEHGAPKPIKQNNLNNNTRRDAADGDSKRLELCERMLVEFGLSRHASREIVEHSHVTPDLITFVLEKSAAAHIKNPSGFCRACLRDPAKIPDGFHEFQSEMALDRQNKRALKVADIEQIAAAIGRGENQCSLAHRHQAVCSLKDDSGPKARKTRSIVVDRMCRSRVADLLTWAKTRSTQDDQALVNRVCRQTKERWPNMLIPQQILPADLLLAPNAVGWDLFNRLIQACDGLAGEKEDIGDLQVTNPPDTVDKRVYFDESEAM